MIEKNICQVIKNNIKNTKLTRTTFTEDVFISVFEVPLTAKNWHILYKQGTFYILFFLHLSINGAFFKTVYFSISALKLSLEPNTESVMVLHRRQV